jgi:hypothetical protein
MPNRRRTNRRRNTRTGGKHLTKTEKKETKAIVNATLNRKLESKYFNCKSITDSIALYRCRTNTNGIGVRGFATCEDKNAQGTRIQYGRDTSDNSVKYLTELNMNRSFSDQDSAGTERSNSIVGHYCNPSLAQSEFILERDYLQSSAGGSDYSTLNVAPYFVRVLRLCPRPTKLSTVDIDPENDAFVNELGQQTGVADSAFGPAQLMLYKVNSRKYKVVGDIKFEMVPPFTTTEVDTGIGTDALVTNIAKSGFMKKLVMRHDIGKKLYFESGSGSSGNSTAGQKNEFILFHTCQLGINSTNSLSSNSALNLLMSGKFVSTFKDP